MKKTLALVALISLGAALIAAPKNTLTQLASCLWQDTSGVLKPLDGRPFSIYTNDAVGLGADVEYWWGTPSDGEFVSVGQTGRRILTLWFDPIAGQDSYAQIYASPFGAYLDASSGTNEVICGVWNGVPILQLGAVSITAGSQAPSLLSNQPGDGSLYLRVGDGLYVKESGSWVKK